MNIHFKFDTADVLRNTDPKALARPVGRAMRQSALAVQREAQIAAPVDTGRLRGDIKTEIEKRRPFPTWAKVGPKVFYGIFVELGTGIFGPKRRRIRPTSKRALSFMVGGERVTVRSVRGMRARPFMKPALGKAKGRIQRIWKTALRDIAQGPR